MLLKRGRKTVAATALAVVVSMMLLGCANDNQFPRNRLASSQATASLSLIRLTMRPSGRQKRFWRVRYGRGCLDKMPEMLGNN
ncbi:hypothetical protein [Paenibacillus thiaminolyticus]|uniref:hypothetical protein n=1 Tax=Paenibacillus thiaminolyticus TaxID=49283 RepID=UPI0030B96E00